MTLSEARARLPAGYTIELDECRSFYRATIYSPMGQPQGIGEAGLNDPLGAIWLAMESFERGKRDA